MKKETKFSDFKRNKENPFLKQAIQEIDNNVVKKYKSSSGSDKKAILQAFNPVTGEVLGKTTFLRQIEVDEQQFTKIYNSHFKAFFGLSERAIRVFGYIQTKLIPNSDEFIFIIEECLEYTEYKTKKAIYSGLTELIQSEIIAKGKTEFLFYINPMILFNGNRVTFAQTYIKKTINNNSLTDNKQLNIFPD